MKEKQLRDAIRQIVNAEKVGSIWHNWEPVKKKILTELGDQYNLEQVLQILKTEFDKLARNKSVRSYHNFQKVYQQFFVKFDQEVNQRYIDIPLFNGDTSTTIIDSDLGTGKSELFKRLIVHNNPSSTALFFNARRSLAKTTAARFNIIDYEDKLNLSPVKNKLSLCTNSALKLIGDNFYPHFVVWDECILNIEHLLSDAVPSDLRENLFNHLLSITENAQHVVLAQSGVTVLAETFLRFINRTPVKILNSYRPWENVQCDFFKYKASLTEKMLNTAKSGIPFLCACNSSEQAKSLFLLFSKQLKSLKFLLINSKTLGDEQNRFIENPNQQDNYSGIFFSPVIESGLSIDSHFVETFGYCSSSEYVNTPEAFVQMLMRGRKVKKISVWVDARKNSLPTTWKRCVPNVLAHLNIAPTKHVKIDGSIQYHFDSSNLIELAIEKKIIENNSRNNCQWTVKFLLERKGLDINYIDERSVVGTQILADSKKLLLHDYQKNILAAKKIDDCVFARLQRKKQGLTESEHWVLSRYQLEHNLCLDLNELSNVELDGFFKFWNYGYALNHVLAIEESLISVDRALAIGKKKQLTDARTFYCRWFIRSGLLKSLHINLNGSILQCDKNYRINFQNLLETDWVNFANKNIDLVNMSNLCQQVVRNVVCQKAIRCWIRSMGIVINKQFYINEQSMFWLIKVVSKRNQS